MSHIRGAVRVPFERKMDHRKLSLLFDLQSLQNGSSTRGIGRYTREHLRALAAHPESPFELHCSVDLTYQTQAEEVLAEVSCLVSSDRLHGYRYPSGLWKSYPTQEPETVFAEELIRLHVESMAPSVVHVPSLFEGAVEQCASLGRIARARGSVSSCLLHDLIPLVMSDRYLAEWRIREWYEHKISQLREFDVLLANSESSRRDAINLLDVDPERVHVVYAGYSAGFRPPAEADAARARLSHRFGLSSPFVLYTGNNDYRKNTRGAISGFAAIPRAARKGLTLVLNQTESEQELRRFAQQCGLETESLMLTGYVTDSELTDLYACCQAFVFPSRYEGFGLPVIEAMACGAPVLVGDNSSLKEIVELDEARFDADSTQAMAAAMQRVLDDDGWRNQLREYGLRRARVFSWKRTAELSIHAWRTAIERRDRAAHMHDSSSKIAIVMPERVAPGTAKHWVDRVSLFLRSGNIELASSDPGQWPAYMHVQRFPGEPLSVDAGLDLIILLHVGGEGMVMRGLAFPGTSEPRLRDQWPGLSRLLSQAVLPVRNQALPELLSECLGVLDACQDGPDIVAAIAPMLRRSPLVVKVADVDPGTALEWIEGMRARYASISTANVVGLLRPCMPPMARSIAFAVQEALVSAGSFGGVRRVLIDMSELARVDYGTGIQRVVRNLVRELCLRNTEGRLLFVPIYHEGETIRSAHALVKRMLGVDCPLFDEAEGIRPRDLLFLADSAWVSPQRFLRTIGQVRRHGGEVAIFYHDIIPLRFPHTCGEGMAQAFRTWTEFAVAQADLFICNSRTTADDLASWIEENQPPRRHSQRFGFVHLGSDVVEPHGESGVRDEVKHLFAADQRTFIAVGTLEPRKDYATILKAFETAWDCGLRANLLIIGKNGWGSDALVARIRESRHFNHRLFWPEKVSNDELDLAYRSAAGLVQASVSEGFGLPIVEAARYGTPLLLSDIDVFREIADVHARYFPVHDAAALSALLSDLNPARSDALAASVLSWQDYGHHLRDLLLQGPWEVRSGYAV